MKLWYDNEIIQFNYEKGGFSQKTIHFTQVVWKSSQELGIGYVRKGINIYVVANYSPPGNYRGQYQHKI